MKKSIVVTGGGTGGHLSIAKVLIDEFKKRDFHVIFIGSTYGADQKWFKEYENIDKTFFYDTQGVVNKGFVGKVLSLFKIFIATLKSVYILKQYKVAKVISVGGFSASPASFASLLTRTDFYIHEQNSVMGKLNKITSKWSKNIFGSYDNATQNIDYPIQKIFFEKQRIREKINTIIFLGGSQGSKAINDFALSIASKLKEMNINIIHQAGINDEKRVKEEYKKLNIDADCFGFSNNLIEKLINADIALCRAGAGTIWETAALGIPSFFVPYPYAAANHQYYNAKAIEDKDLGVVCNEKDLNEKAFFDFLKSDIKTKSKGLIEIINPNGVEKLVDSILID
jgi:UDP-N-acetylglucosamine--N-acetylmuramyl-(pentapeptide) pyrophosphoryl-undecaprenol N-acetylglucosamine transferase